MAADQPGLEPPCEVFLRPARVPVDELEALELGYEMYDALMRSLAGEGAASTDPGDKTPSP